MMLNTANLKKTWYYFQKNGIIDTFYAVKERFYAKNSPLYPDRNYSFEPVTEAELEKQRSRVFQSKYRFSILVPMYETDPKYAKEMIDSVLEQTYPYFELILADASKSDTVQKTVASYQDERIRYHRLEKNAGISENTNAALALAEGDYIGLLDHDDLLTPDALYEMACAIEETKKTGNMPAFLYSDEDKCNSSATVYYEVNRKPNFNFDLLLSNNYICHFLVMKSDLMKKLRFRREYDGAQDFDLVLRAALLKAPEEKICHIGKVLYHWRCHGSSTAENPRSKSYAYEVGKKAVLDALFIFLERQHGTLCQKQEEGILVDQTKVSVVHTRHNGFYRVVYGNETAEDIFKVRKDVGIIAGSLKKNNKITGGIKNAEGICPYNGLPVRFSGYLHRNVLVQDCEQADLENAVIRPQINKGYNILKQELTNNDSVVCDSIRKKGYIILYDPLFEKKKR